MMGLVYPWVCVQTGIDHDPVDEVIHHGGDAVDTAEPLVKAGRILSSHRPLLLLRKVGEVDTIASVAAPLLLQGVAPRRSRALHIT